MPSQSSQSSSLDQLFLDTLKDIYYAEKQILRALPKMARAANSNDLKQAFQKHREQTQGHVERLDQVFEQLGKRAQGKTCDAIQGIIHEGEEIIQEFKDENALDAGLIAAAQAVEHYEIARYGTLRRWAEELGHSEAADLLQQTLDEEKETDQLLTGLADGDANKRAQEGGTQARRNQAAE